MTMAVLPLHPDDPEWIRKARVAELHDLLLKAGYNLRLFQLLLDHRHGRRLDQREVEPEPAEPVCSHCHDQFVHARDLCAPCYEYHRSRGRLPDEALLARRRNR